MRRDRERGSRGQGWGGKERKREEKRGKERKREEKG